MNITVWFSNGAASAVAAKKTVEMFPDATVTVVNNPVMEELADNERFKRDVEQWIGQPILTAMNPKFPSASCVDVWHKHKFMSAPNGAPCTMELKKRARQLWESTHYSDLIVLGFTADEGNRVKNFIRGERSDLYPVLHILGMTKQDCFREIEKAGIEMPEAYRLGYPNNNCIGCVKATSPTYWNHVRRVHPEVFKERAEQSDVIGAKLVRVKGERIPLSQLDPEAKGKPMKDTYIECGIFCEEQDHE